MASGCVPVVSHIRGSTDFVVKNGVNGLLFPVDQATAPSTILRQLAVDRSLLRRLSQSAANSYDPRFTITSMCTSYAELIRTIERDPPPIRKPLPIEKWKYPSQFEGGIRRYVPEAIKRLVMRLRAT